MCDNCRFIPKDETCENCYQNPKVNDKVYGHITELCDNCFKKKRKKLEKIKLWDSTITSN